MRYHVTGLLIVLVLSLSFVSAHEGHDHDHDHHDHDHEHDEPVVDDKDVVVLGSNNFQETISKNAHVLVEFYAPWCGHCKHLAPIYAQVATTLKQEGSPIVIAKVDATVNEDIAQEQNIQGFPTLKFFRQGVPVEYQGERSEADIIAWLKRKSGPPSTVLASQEAIDAFLAKPGVKVIAYVGEDEATGLSHWEKAANSGQIEDFAVGHVADSSLFAGNTAGTFTIHKPGEEVIKFTGKFNTDDIVEFVKVEGYPIIRQLDQDLWSLSSSSQKPLVAIFVAENTDVSEFNSAALQFKGQVFFSSHPSPQLAERWGASGSVLPTAILVLWTNGEPKFTVFNEETPFNNANLLEFTTSGLQGTYVSYKKSQPIPESNNDPVFVLVGKQFDEIVYDTNRDVFVEFYAPWCGHCRSLAPIYDELGTEFANHKDKVLIAKFDATANSANDKISIQGFPTLIFFPANNKEGIPYEGERDLASLKKFVLENSSFKTALKAALGTKEDL